MSIVYVGTDFKCHAANDGTMTAVEDGFFDGKCPELIEGYCYDNSKGYPQIYPWKPLAELEKAQREYERQLLAQYAAELDDMRDALSILGVSE